MRRAILIRTVANQMFLLAYLAAIFVCALSYWYLVGRKWYVGPLIEAEIMDEALSSKEKAELGGSDKGSNDAELPTKEGNTAELAGKERPSELP